jgi:hypothetical protein
MKITMPATLAAANALFRCRKNIGPLTGYCFSAVFPPGTGFRVRFYLSGLKLSMPEEVGITNFCLVTANGRYVIQRGIDGKAFPGCQLLVVKNGIR